MKTMLLHGLFFLALISSFHAIDIHDSLLHYWQTLPVRDPSTIDLIVIHFTEECTLESAQALMNMSRYSDGTGNSGHYTIDRNGTIYRDVPYNHTAYHVIGYNDRAIGIENVNIGRYPDYFDSRSQTPLEPWSDALVLSIVDLVNYLKSQLPNIKYIAGHDELDVTYIPATDDPTNCTLVRRKTDPGPQFPWDTILTMVDLQHYQPYGQPGYEPIHVCNQQVNATIQPTPNVNIIDDFLPYVDKLPTRNVSQIDLIVIHYTEECNLASARTAMETVYYGDGTGNSGHYTVDRNGTVYRYVPYDHKAWNVIGYNDRSIGIENVNIGGYPKADDSHMQNPHEPFMDGMIDNLVALILKLKSELPNVKYISGHNDLDVTWQPSTDDPNCVFVRRKLDPGPMFPWDRVVKAVGLTRYQPHGQVPLGPINNCTVVNPACSCPNGWIKSELSGDVCTCYNFAAGAKNYSVANNNCHTWGNSMNVTALTSIGGAFENADILQLSKERVYDCAQLYIGLTRQDGIWTWNDGNPNVYRNWAAGYPVSDPNANCAVYNQAYGTWSNVPCNKEMCYICKIAY